LKREIKEIDANKMKHQFVYGDGAQINKKTKEKESSHYHEDPKVMRVNNTQCRDILFTGKYNDDG